jgi:hypothetical protein
VNTDVIVSLINTVGIVIVAVLARGRGVAIKQAVSDVHDEVKTINGQSQMTMGQLASEAEERRVDNEPT